MKKLFLVLVALLIAVPVFAEPIKIGNLLDKIELKQGIGYSIVDHKINYLSTIELAKWKKFNFEAGVSGDGDSSDWMGVAVVSYKLGNLQQFGIDLPILNYLDCNIGMYVGYGHINMQELDNSRLSWGPSVTLVNLKF